jgi:Acetyl/propionyl-CoA carboxylase, alpha subunit
VDLHSEVSIHYDPMIAKLAVWGKTRPQAIDRLRRALDEYDVSGLTTTLPFFREVVRDTEFQGGQLDTSFIERFNSRRASAPPAVPAVEESHMAIIAASLAYHRRQQHSTQRSSRASNGWKMSGRQAALNARQHLTRETSSKWRKT